MRQRWVALAIIVAGLVAPGLALAYGVGSGETVTLAKGQTKAGTYYTAGRTITIDGDVDGDLVCGGQTVTVNGAVHGDVLCAGQTVTVNGPVDGSVRVAGQLVTVNGVVGRNVTVMGQSLTLDKSAKVAGDAGLLGQTVSLGGTVAREVYGAMDMLTIEGTTGPVDAHLTDLRLGDSAKVNGDVNYSSEQTIDLAQSKVTGQIHHHIVQTQRRQSDSDKTQAWLLMRLYWILAALVVGLAWAWLAPRVLRALTRTLDKQAGASLGWGLLISFLLPMGFIVVAVTVVGAPLALLALLAWVVVAALSSVIVGVWLGQWLLRRADWNPGSLVWAAAIGVPIATILMGLPVVGPLLGLLALWWAVGATALAARTLRR